MGSQKTVVIANFGSHGMMGEDDYDGQVESWQRWIEQEEAEVEVVTVDSRDELAALVGRWPRPNVVVFRSRGMIDLARKIRREHGVYCVVFTGGGLPRGEITIASKSLKPASMVDLILRN